MRPHRRQPTRLHCPWDSPGKNTGVGCHFLLQCMKVKVKSLSRVWLLATPWTAAYRAPMPMGFSTQEYWNGVPWPSPAYVSWYVLMTCQGFYGSIGKESACNVWDPDSIPKSGRSPGEVNGNLLQYSCLENPRDGRAWWAAIYGVAQGLTQLKRLSSSIFHHHSRQHPESAFCALGFWLLILKFDFLSPSVSFIDHPTPNHDPYDEVWKTAVV